MIDKMLQKVQLNEFDINWFLKEFIDIYRSSEDYIDFFGRMETLSLDVEEMIERSRENINLLGEIMRKEAEDVS